MDAGKVIYMDVKGAGSGSLAAMYPFPSHPIPRVDRRFVL